MFIAEVASRLQREIEALISSIEVEDSFKALIRYPLKESGRPLSSPVESCIPMLPLLVCNSICGKYEQALPVTAAVGFLQTAGDIFDDIEDDDLEKSTSLTHSRPEAINIATVLLLLSQLALTKLKEANVDSDTAISIIEEASKYGITACHGQHLDIGLKDIPNLSEENYLKTISSKSASQIECACRIGAMLATKDDEIINIYALFGHNLGMASQLANDIHGITKAKKGKSDIAKRAITLPVIYALANAQGEERNILDLVYEKKKTVSDLIESNVIELLFNIGAIHYTIVTMEVYRQKALSVLKKLGKFGVNTEELTDLLQSLKSEDGARQNKARKH